MKFSLHSFSTLLKVIAPVVLPFVPNGDKLAPFVGQIMHGIDEAEQIPGATGPEKKAHVMNIVAIGAGAAGTHVTLDQAEVLTTANAGIDAVIGAIKLVQNAHPRPVVSAPSTE